MPFFFFFLFSHDNNCWVISLSLFHPLTPCVVFFSSFLHLLLSSSSHSPSSEEEGKWEWLWWKSAVQLGKTTTLPILWMLSWWLDTHELVAFSFRIPSYSRMSSKVNEEKGPIVSKLNFQRLWARGLKNIQKWFPAKRPFHIWKTVA